MSSTAALPKTESPTKKVASWLPLLVVVLTQIQASFAVNTLTVSMQGISTDLSMPATSIGTAITTGTFAMAAFILLGAKLGAKFGSRRVFQIAVLIHAVSMAVIAASVNSGMLFIAQAASGAVIALIAPALVVFISSNYRGDQQAKAIGYLAAAIPAAGVLALLIAGSFASTIGWRYSFVLIAVLGLVNFALSFRFKIVPPQKGLTIDWVGALLAAGSIILLSFGFSGLTSWGAFLATDNAPFQVGGISPAPILIVLGAIVGQLFFTWLRRQKSAGNPQIFDLAVLKGATEKATTFCMAAMLFIGTAANFLIPLYIQVVQGLSSFETSLSIIPYTLSIFAANSVVASFYKRFAPRNIARVGFVIVTAALVLIAFTVRNEWSQFFVVVGLVLLGLGQGAIVALVFNTLLSSAPKKLAGDVGAWRGLVHNISGSVGIAVATVFAVGMLGSFIGAGLKDHPQLPPEVQIEFPLDSVNFVTNDHLADVLASTSATDSQIAEAVTVNEEARLQALKVSMLGLAGIAALAIIPAGRMPGFARNENDEIVAADDQDDSA
jgi:MFS family permease